MTQQILITNEQSQLIESISSKINSDKTSYYFMPFWFEKTFDDKWYIHHLDNLPEQLKKLIGVQRNPTINFTKEVFENFKKCYNEAVENQLEQFSFYNETYLVDYSKYLIEYLELKFKN